MRPDSEERASVRAFWEEEACGERLVTAADSLDAGLEEQARERYTIEPYLVRFARFEDGRGRAVLEIGVGLGADHLEWAKRQPARLVGIDLTAKAVEYTGRRLAMHGFSSDLRVADAEALPFEDDTFDIVWSWGVLHHSPDTSRAIDEVYRVLKPGGRARVMLYHKNGLVFLLAWLRHSWFRGRPWRSRDDVIARELESAGTKAYTRRGAAALFRRFAQADCRTTLTMGDLLEGPIGRRHGGRLLEFMKAVWPRRLIRLLGDRVGSDLLIEAVK